MTRGNWTVEDYKAEQEAVEALGAVGRAEVLAELLKARASGLSAASSSADYLLDLARREPEAVDVLGYVRSLDARELLSADAFRAACRERFEAARKASESAPARPPVGEAVCEEVERIEAAALRWSGQVLSLPSPARHADVYKRAESEWGYETTYGNPVEEGFLTSVGRFVDRVEAGRIARASGQARVLEGQKLQTVDLW